MPPAFGLFSGIDIPPGKADFTITDSFTLPVDLDLFGISAHAHYIAKTFHLTERFKFNLTCSSSNVLNHPNFLPPSGNISATNVGVINSVRAGGESRQMGICLTQVGPT